MQLIIDSSKREYEVDGMDEINRIRKLPSMQREQDFPLFMRHTREIAVTKNGKERSYEDIKADRRKLESRIDYELVCPMNYLQECLNNIPIHRQKNSVNPTSDYFIKFRGEANRRQMKKIKELVKEYDSFTRQFSGSYAENKELITEKFSDLVENISKIKVRNPVTINRLLEISMGVETLYKPSEPDESTKYCTKIMNVLYRVDKDKFLSNFVKGE